MNWVCFLKKTYENDAVFLLWMHLIYKSDIQDLIKPIHIKPELNERAPLPNFQLAGGHLL